MAEYTPRTPSERLLDVARSTEAWLDREVAGRELSISVSAMAATLRRYTRRSRRMALTETVSQAEADRRIHRMLQAMYEVMAAQGL